MNGGNKKPLISPIEKALDVGKYLLFRLLTSVKALVLVAFLIAIFRYWVVPTEAFTKYQLGFLFSIIFVAALCRTIHIARARAIPTHDELKRTDKAIQEGKKYEAQ